jgi:hypothetical protein
VTIHQRAAAGRLSSRNVLRPRRQFYSVRRVEHGTARLLGEGLRCPPCNIGPLSTPDYPRLAHEAVHLLPGSIKCFAGQRADGLYVDLGSIFDLGNLRPFEQLHNQFGMHVFSHAAPGVNSTNRMNVHSIALQVPISELVRGRAHSASQARSVIGVWTTASRQRVRIWDADRGENVDSGPFRQVSRLGNPLVNEVLIPLGKKDRWNTLPPSDDKRFAEYFTSPGLAALLPGLYPGVCDLAGFPNGRRVSDDVVTIEIRAIAGLTYPLIDKKFTPDGAASLVTDGLTAASVRAPYLAHFPYLGVPYSGFSNPS